MYNSKDIESVKYVGNETHALQLYMKYVWIGLTILLTRTMEPLLQLLSLHLECPLGSINILIIITSGSASFSSSVPVLVSQTKLRIRSALGVAAFTPYWLRSPE